MAVNSPIANQPFFAAEFAGPVQLAPDFILADRNNNLIHLSDFRCKVVLLNFWASWCQRCQHEMPDLQTLVYE